MYEEDAPGFLKDMLFDEDYCLKKQVDKINFPHLFFSKLHRTDITHYKLHSITFLRNLEVYPEAASILKEAAIACYEEACRAKKLSVSKESYLPKKVGPKQNQGAAK
ncbi:hypothetical protein ACMG4P_21705 [Pseudovibrio denitrificans]|uniref:hypothetical protein n=1 Tax=Pseudovibrio denitrificans TaxID=258256 RepID=UPI0039BFF1AC